MIRALLACLLVGVAASVAAAADDVIEPDRPSVTTGARIVRPGRVQLEAGLLWQRTSLAAEPTERRLSAESTVRVGVLDALEVRLEGEPIVRLRGADDATDVGDLTLSAKWRFLDAPDDAPWPALGVMPFVKLPTAPEPIGTGKTDVGLRLIAGFTLPADMSLDANVGVAALGQTRSGGTLVQAQASAALSRELTRGLSAFVEVFYTSREEREGRDRVGVDAGLAWRLLQNVALDVAAGTSLYGQLPDVFVRAGGSIRFGR
jgi:hypothetical protein